MVAKANIKRLDMNTAKSGVAGGWVFNLGTGRRIAARTIKKSDDV